MGFRDLQAEARFLATWSLVGLFMRGRVRGWNKREEVGIPVGRIAVRYQKELPE